MSNHETSHSAIDFYQEKKQKFPLKISGKSKFSGQKSSGNKRAFEYNEEVKEV